MTGGGLAAPGMCPYIFEYKRNVMSKTITMRVDDDTYNLIKTAADGERRSISNYIEYATLAFLAEESFISDNEMEEILKNDTLMKSLKQGKKEIEEGKYRIVG